MNESKSVMKEIVDECQWSQQQPFLDDILNVVEKLRMLSNTVAVHVLGNF